MPSRTDVRSAQVIFRTRMATWLALLATSMPGMAGGVEPPAEAPPLEAQDTRPQDVQQATQPAHRTHQGWQDRNALINQRATESEWDVVFMGDSITQGWEKAGRRVWARYYADRNAGNLGISGDQTEHLAWRIENGNLADQTPRLGVIMIGTNNLGNARHSPEAVIAGIEKVLATYKQQCPESKVLLLGIFPRSQEPDAPVREQIQTINDQIRKFADQKQVHYLDIGKAFLEEDGKISKQVMPDFLHLSPAGYERWAKAIEPTVAKLLQDETPKGAAP